MFKSILFGSILLFGINSFADSALQGTWCRRFDDFTAVLKIEESGKLESFSVGSHHPGERTLPQFGYVSIGANAFQVVIEGEDMGYVDYNITNSVLGGKKRLSLYKSQGGKDIFKSCRIAGR